MGEPTIHDVAKQAGVSAATVSRALNGGLVKSQTRERVRAVAQTLGYRSGGSPRRSSAVRAESIGILVTDIGNFYFADLFKGLFAVAHQHSCQLIVDDLNVEDADEVVDRVTAATAGQIVIAPRLEADMLRARFDPAKTVLVSRQLEGYVTACADDQEGMVQAMRHMASLGHRKVAYVGGSEGSWTNAKRREAFLGCADQFGLESRILGPFEPSYGGGINACDAVMLEHDLTGIVVFNDLMATGLLGGLLERGVRVPGDLSLIGFDNSVLSRVVRPRLTTVDVRQERLGGSAMRILLDMLHVGQAEDETLQGDQNQGLVIPEMLITRDSTAVPSSESRR